MWSRPGQKDFFGETMREIWATPEHQAKIEKTNARRRADPAAVAAMRARLDANRMKTRAQRSAAIAAARGWRRLRDVFSSNEEMDDWIVAQYQAGSSARQISEQLGLAHNTVARRIRDRGVVMPVRGAGRRTPALSARHLAKKGITDLAAFDREVAELYAEGNGVSAIARVYGINSEPVRTALYRSGVTLRGKGGRPSKIPPFRSARRPKPEPSVEELLREIFASTDSHVLAASAERRTWDNEIYKLVRAHTQEFVVPRAPTP